MVAFVAALIVLIALGRWLVLRAKRRIPIQKMDFKSARCRGYENHAGRRSARARMALDGRVRRYWRRPRGALDCTRQTPTAHGAVTQ